MPTSVPRPSPVFVGASAFAASDCFSALSPDGFASGTCGTMDVDSIGVSVGNGTPIDFEMELTTSLAAGGCWPRTDEALGAGGGRGGGARVPAGGATFEGSGGGRTIVMNPPAFSTGWGCREGACGKFTTGLLGTGGRALGWAAGEPGEPGEAGEAAPDAADCGLADDSARDATDWLLSPESGESRLKR